MYWELHDDGSDGQGTLFAGLKNVICDYEYQYEQHVIDIWKDYPECVEIRCFLERAPEGQKGGAGKPIRVLKRGDKW